MNIPINHSVKTSAYHVEVLDRALAIIEVLSLEGPGLSLGDLAEKSGLHKSTVHRLLSVLERHRYVEKKQKNNTYCLGLKLFELGSKALAQLDLSERARPHLERLAQETGETAHLCILDDAEVLYLEKVEAPRTVRIPSVVGQRYPVHCGASGKTLLAFLPESQIDEIITRKGMKAFTRNTITTLAGLKQALRTVRVGGYALDDEEFEVGLKCIGAPVRDHAGKVVASIGIAGLAFRLTEDTVPALIRAVKTEAKSLSIDLGWREPSS